MFLHENAILFQVVLAGAFYPNYFTFGQPDEEMAVRELAGKDPKTTVVVGAAFPFGYRGALSLAVSLVARARGFVALPWGVMACLTLSPTSACCSVLLPFANLA